MGMKLPWAGRLGEERRLVEAVEPLAGGRGGGQRVAGEGREAHVTTEVLEVVEALPAEGGQEHEGLEEFRRLGARLDEEAAEAELAAVVARRAVPVHAHRTFLFTDIVGSTTLAGALGDAAWERLLGWHDETLRAHFAKSGGEVVKSTGDGFFVAFRGAREALDCAAAIQRALEEHRRSSGFAPPVRMGLHTAEAVQRGSDYSGVGVHVAARVADLAGAGEIDRERGDTACGRPQPWPRRPRGVIERGRGTGLDRLGGLDLA